MMRGANDDMAASQGAAARDAAQARAEARQLEASDPAVSAFVAASAGSGKTKLLTDRLLRLMLAGADPSRILCLTYTRAAAAEMALRLQRTLGIWVSLDDAALDDRLRALEAPATPAARATARALFARVLDLPGGMRIGTIHAFCQSLLRRFPLEAQLSPHFRVVEEADAAAALAEAREAMLEDAATPQARAALDELAGLATLGQFAGLLGGLLFDRERLAALLGLDPDAIEDGQHRLAGVVREPPELLLRRACDWPEAEALAAQLRAGHAHPKVSETMRARLRSLLDWLALPPALRAERWERWSLDWLKLDGAPRQHHAYYPKAQAAALAGLAAACTAEQARVLAVAERLRALRMARASAALLRLALPVLRHYAQHKDRSGLLDYSDLIGVTSRLLVDPGAAWVLFKLDGGLDHLLLDEVQDTAPAQWAITHKLTEEFFAGRGAGRPGRSCFAVGDRKQSIYAFQGADISGFDAARATLRARVTAAGQDWRDTALDVSFRSTEAVLALVDAVFAAPQAAAGVAEPAGSLRHHAIRTGQAGRVELWPLAPQAAPPERTPWTVPERNTGAVSAPQRLADMLARWIAAETAGGVVLPSRGRALAPGDVLVLVRRRSAGFAAALVAALKLHGVPVAGLDRMVLTDQPAVQDVLALCETLLLPQDDLSLAAVLTSPLGGLDDDSLAALAVGRVGSLWATLRRRAGERADWDAAWRFLAALFARVDHASPHALLAEALGPLGGRARLLARLGPEAADPLDEVLALALGHAAVHPPSLQGFLHWLRQGRAEVKREADAGGPMVRVMTVHGAKGLQAPLVILPDTVGLPPDPAGLVWAEDAALGADLPLWTPRREFACAATEAARQQRQRLAEEEQNRLLYVALTRAEDRLVVCGWQPARPLPERCWYALVRAGFAALPAVAVAFAPFAPVPPGGMPWGGAASGGGASGAGPSGVGASGAGASGAGASGVGPSSAGASAAAPPGAGPSGAGPGGAAPWDGEVLVLELPRTAAAPAGQAAGPGPGRPDGEVAGQVGGGLFRQALGQAAGPMAARAGGAAAPAVAAEQALAPPAWAGTAPLWRAAPPPEEPPGPLALAPSRPEGVELGTLPRAASPLAARDAAGARFRRGRLVHALLQHLPALPPAERVPAAQAWLRRPGQGLTDVAADALAVDVMAVLAHPDLAPLFGPGSRAEVPLTGVVGGRVVGGLVDRLAVRPDAVLLADFKTNRDPPARPAQTPVAYLRQMAAYRAVLAAIYADRPVRCVLVWTQAARVDVLPEELLALHAPVA
jgi:ATP-dependent helicase/nuclease subunit A